MRERQVKSFDGDGASASRRAWTWKRILLTSSALLFGGLALGTALLVMAGLHDHIGKADAALVLGSKVQPDGAPSPRLRARLDRTLELYRAGYFSMVIVSGGIGKEGYDEAAVMRDYLAARGVPSDQIVADSDGVTTFASARNARHTAEQRKIRSIFVISQYFHLPRARLALSKCGFAPIYSAHARYFELRDFYSCPRELAGYLRYLFRAP